MIRDMGVAHAFLGRRPVDGSRDLSILVTLARLQSTNRLGWLGVDQQAALIERLGPASQRLGRFLLGEGGNLSPEDETSLGLVRRLAGVAK
jgi:hypothetical protein